MKIFYYFIFVVLVISCSNSKKIEIYENESITIPIKKIRNWKIGKYSDIYDSIKLVQLETNKESIIGRIDKLISWDNKFFILDQVQRKSVLVFNDKGKFLNCIGEIGKGPGEYIEPNDFAVNYYNNEIAVWCNTTQRIVFYNFQGNFKRQLKLDYYIKSFTFLKDEKIALYLDVDFNIKKEKDLSNLVVVDYNGKQIFNAFGYPDVIGTERGGFNFFDKIDKESTFILPGYVAFPKNRTV